MSDRAVVAICRVAAACGAAAGILGSVLLIVAGHAGFWIEEYLPAFVVIAVGLGAFAWLLISRQPRNAVVWTMVVASSTSGMTVAAYAALTQVSERPPAELVAAVPAALPLSARWLLLVGAPGWAVGLFSLLTFGLVLFPDGHLPSPRWRVVGWLAAACTAAAMFAYAVALRPTSTVHPDDGVVVNAVLAVHLATAMSCLVALLGRFRRSRGTTRRQFEWVTWGAAIFVASYVVVVVADTTWSEWFGRAMLVVGVAVLVASYGIAVGRYRLYDIDLVASRTLVYGTLAGLITGVHALVAVGIGGLVGGSDLGLAVLATAIVAVAFEPARTRVQRWANRLVRGARATPYEVLSEITGTLETAETEERLFQRVASSLAAGTGAQRAGVWLTDGEGFVTAATSPPGDPLVRPDTGSLPGDVHLVDPEGEVLGALTAEKARGDALTAPERSLMADLAGSTALVMRRLRLDAELHSTAQQLERSRRRLLDVQDEERRRLERDLRDGVERLVVVIRSDLDDARRLAHEEGTGRAAVIVDQLVDDTDVAAAQIRALAQGLVPPLLEVHGLASAVAALAEHSHLDVRVDVGLTGRHPPEVEAAVYFCVCEALTNVSKHARGPVAITVGVAAGGLCFAVTDAGPGFDPQHIAGGAGLGNMTDRLDVLGGAITVTSAPGASTTIAGVVPVDAASMV